MIEEALKSRIGVVIISIIWGLGLSTIFRKACNGRTCHLIRYVGPNPEEVASNYYNYGSKLCYQYNPIMAPCDTTQSK